MVQEGPARGHRKLGSELGPIHGGNGASVWDVDLFADPEAQQ
jgi:hypothetical protein